MNNNTPMTEQELTMLLANIKLNEELPEYTITKLTEAVVGIYVSQTIGFRQNKMIMDLMSS